jgi:hypothetical protein
MVIQPIPEISCTLYIYYIYILPSVMDNAQYYDAVIASGIFKRYFINFSECVVSNWEEIINCELKTEKVGKQCIYSL